MAINLKKLKEFLNYWYVRYLLATELYIVEPWERIIVHVVFVVLFVLFWQFNSSLVQFTATSLTGTKHYVEEIS